MLSLALAKRATTGLRRDLLGAIRPGGPENADVILATPPRFLSPRKLIRPNEAIDGMLQVFVTAQAICADMDVSCRLTTDDGPLPGSPKLFLSHHTVETPQTAHLRNTGTMVRHFKAADLPGRTTLDPLGFSGWSSMAAKTAQDLPLEQVDQGLADRYFATANAATAQNISKYAQSRKVDDISGKYVFVALQTINDMVQRKAFVAMLDMLDMVIARFADSGMRVVVKRHPKCRSTAVKAALGRHAKQSGITIAYGSIHRLIANAQAVMTVNSGVGSEALVHAVPLYCFGASDYAAAAHQIRSIDDLNRTTQPIKHRLAPAELRRFHYFYRENYQIDRATQLTPRLTELIKTALKVS